MLSSVATLNSISVSSGSLVPYFNKNILSYTVNVLDDINSITINATKTDSKATVSGTGVKTLNYGTNTFNIVVTAEDKTVKTYVLKVMKTDQRSIDTTLESLIIGNVELNPKFKATIREYEVTVGSDVQKLEIEAIPSSDKATINIAGNENLKTGKNIITLKVTSENGISSEYQLVVNKLDKGEVKVPIKEEKPEASNPEKENKDYSGILYITMAGTLVLLICLGILILRMND
ncbi:MAG: cadherin-like beta sandwich domain-containing protein [Bacilli bacterium]|nr:cadherin-like beta sandwich domain-containing protein [Bacilli bacterium]